MKRVWLYLYGFVLLIFLLGGIGLAKSIDIWSVSGKINADGSRVTITGNDVDEIKGWMTLEEVIKSYQLDQGEIYKTFNLPEDLPVITPLKDIASQTDEALSPAIIREFILQKQAGQ